MEVLDGEFAAGVQRLGEIHAGCGGGLVCARPHLIETRDSSFRDRVREAVVIEKVRNPARRAARDRLARRRDVLRRRREDASGEEEDDEDGGEGALHRSLLGGGAEGSFRGLYFLAARTTIPRTTMPYTSQRSRVSATTESASENRSPLLVTIV